MGSNFDSISYVELPIGQNISLVLEDDKFNLLTFLDLGDGVGIMIFPKDIGYHFNILPFNSVDYKIALFGIV